MKMTEIKPLTICMVTEDCLTTPSFLGGEVNIKGENVNLRGKLVWTISIRNGKVSISPYYEGRNPSFRPQARCDTQDLIHINAYNLRESISKAYKKSIPLKQRLFHRTQIPIDELVKQYWDLIKNPVQ